MELKQLRTKAQLEKEEALKNQKEFLTKVYVCNHQFVVIIAL